MSQDLFKLGHGFNCAPRGDERIALRLYFKHASILLRKFGKWKGIDRFYYIPIKLNMTFFCAGWAEAVAYPPYFIGTILRNSLEHPDLFSTECECGHQAYGYCYNGSPLSGRFDISHSCPCCGKEIHTSESGWRIRSIVLRETQAKDLKYGRWIQLRHQNYQPATIQDLLRYLGVSEEDLVLPPEEKNITRSKLDETKVLVSDSLCCYSINNSNE